MEGGISHDSVPGFETGETITVSLEDAAKLILQQQGLDTSNLPPGTYQILTQDGEALDGMSKTLNVKVMQNSQITYAADESVESLQDTSQQAIQMKGGNSAGPNVEQEKNQGALKVISWESDTLRIEGLTDNSQQLILSDQITQKSDNSGETGSSEAAQEPIKDLHVIIEKEEPPSPPQPVPPKKSLDLSKPIEVTNETIVIINGKKCILSANPDTGQLCAYPVLPEEGKRKRGRPPGSGRKKEIMTDRPRKRDPVIEQTNAAEGLLELSNTGPDGVRRSARARKKAKLLDDYEVNDSGDDDIKEEIKTEPDDDTDVKSEPDDTEYSPVIRPTRMLTPTTGMKRGRGRPRRYPPPGQSSLPTQIPAVIIPGANGQTIMMAPIQGLSNFQALTEQIRTIPQMITKVSSSSSSLPQPSPCTLVTNLTSTALPETASKSTVSAQPAIPSSFSIPDSSVTSVTVADTLSISNTVSDSIAPETLPSITMATEEAEDDNQQESIQCPTDENLELTEAVDSAEKLNDPKGEVTMETNTTQQGAVVNHIDSKPSDDLDQQTIIRIPENLLPMFLPKKDPIKLGLKFREKELEDMKCPKCNFQAYYPQAYQAHISTHTEETQKCKCCNFVSFDTENLLAHFKETHPRCICDVCDFMAEHAYIIKRHMMRHNAEGCTCDICGKVYKDQYILKMHIKMVHMPAEILFECTVCAKKFTRKAHLKRHLRIHEPEKPYKCPNCDYRGCEKSDISKHILIHEEPKHICQVCGKAFRHIKNKELHMKRHTGQKDYKCGVCEFYGYTFTDIRKHIERKHADIKTPVCEKCGSVFKSETLLQDHMKQQCEIFMIEQALAIATSNGTSQATIQIPSSTLSIDSENLENVSITAEQVTLTEEDSIELTEEQIHASIRDGTLTIPDTQVIESASLSEDQEEVIHQIDHVTDGQVIQVVNQDDPMSEEEEEEEETMMPIEDLSHSVVEQELSIEMTE